MLHLINKSFQKISAEPKDDFWDIPTCHVAGNQVGGSVWDRT